MNHDAMSFFQNISARLSNVRNCARKSRGKREEEAQPQQPLVVVTQPLPPSPLISSPPPAAQEALDGPLHTRTTVSSSRVQATVSARWTGPASGMKDGCTLPRSVRPPGPPDRGKREQDQYQYQEELRQVSSSIMTQVLQPNPKGVREGTEASVLEASRRARGSRETGEPPGEKGESSRRLNGNSNNEGNDSARLVRTTAYESSIQAQVQRIRRMPKNTSPVNAKNHASLLPRQLPCYHEKITLILDLDETLVHSSLTDQLRHHDLVLDVHMENTSTTVYVAFRPFMREFLRAVAPLFEVIIFTASVSVYCNQLMDAIDTDNILGSLRLYREHCSILNGAYVKDLSLLGRDLDRVAIIDNSPVAYLFQQRNAIPIISWFDDPYDNELQQLIPMLETLASEPEVYSVLDQYNAVLQLQQEQARQNFPHY